MDGRIEEDSSPPPLASIRNDPNLINPPDNQENPPLNPGPSALPPCNFNSDEDPPPPDSDPDEDDPPPDSNSDEDDPPDEDGPPDEDNPPNEDDHQSQRNLLFCAFSEAFP